MFPLKSQMDLSEQLQLHRKKKKIKLRLKIFNFRNTEMDLFILVEGLMLWMVGVFSESLELRLRVVISQL